MVRLHLAWSEACAQSLDASKAYKLFSKKENFCCLDNSRLSLGCFDCVHVQPLVDSKLQEVGMRVVEINSDCRAKGSCISAVVGEAMQSCSLHLSALVCSTFLLHTASQEEPINHFCPWLSSSTAFQLLKHHAYVCPVPLAPTLHDAHWCRRLQMPLHVLHLQKRRVLFCWKNWTCKLSWIHHWWLPWQSLLAGPR